MTKTSEDVRGVRTTQKKDLPPIEVMPTNPALGQMKREDQIAWKKKYRAAVAAGEKARREAMLAPEVEPTEENLQEAADNDDRAEKEEKVDDLRAKLAEAEAELEENPKKKGLKARIAKLNKSLDKAEAELE